ncbi:MAG: hypothetical protein MSA21_00955 [Lachnospiraceae bacterium]|nr:hypothetical protein [Lachnospiraceae bacterium]
MDIEINDKSTGEGYEGGWISQNEHKTIEIKMNASISGFESYKIEKIIKDESGNDKVEKEYEEYKPEYISNNNGTEERTVLIGTDKIDNSEKGEYKMEEGDYQIRVTAKNKSGVETVKYISVKYDKTLPNITNESIQADESGWINGSKKDKDICFSITDDFLDSIEFYYKDNTKKKISVEYEYDDDSKQYKIPVKKLPEGVYFLTVDATDMAGNMNKLNVRINKDTKPIGITVNSENYSDWKNNKKNNLEFTLNNEHDDNVVTSGIKEVEAYKVEYTDDDFDEYNYSYNESQKMAIELNKGNPNDQEWKRNKISLKNLDNGKYYIVIIAFDYANNKTAAKYLIQNDTEKSKINFAFKDKDKYIDIADGKWINSKDTKLEVTITDTNGGIAVSGIEGVKLYKYYSEKIKKDAKEQFTTDLKQESKNIVDITPKKTLKNTDKVINDISLSSGHYYIIVTAKDGAGNETMDLQEIKKDIESGEISLTSNIEDDTWINANTNKKDANLKISLSDENWNDKKNNNIVISSGIKTIYIYRSLYNSDNIKKLKEDLKDLSNLKSKDNYVTIEKNKYTYIEDYNAKSAEANLDLRKIPDGKYFIVIVIEDNAGNTNFAYKSIMKDTKKPQNTSQNISETEFGWISEKSINNGSKISVNFVDEYGGESEKEGYQIPSTIKSIKIMADGKEIKNYEQTEIKNGKKIVVPTKELEKLPDGSYSINYIITDYAGNSITKKVDIKKDTKSPDGKIMLISENYSWDLGWNSEPLFEKFSNKSENFKLSYEDSPSGIKRVSYYITKDMASVIGDENTANEKSNNWEELVNNGKNIILKGENTISIGDDNENVNAVIYVKIEDNAGNINLMRSNGITIDHYAPEAMAAGNDEPIISIDVASSDIGQDGIYKSAPVINYDIQDKEYNNVYSGLQEIIYTVTNEDTGVTTGKITVDGVNDGVTRNPEYRGSINLSSLGETVYNGNNITVQITAKDNAENEYKPASKSLSIDTTKPIVNVSYKDSTGAEVEPNGRFFNNDITMVVTVTERNFDADATLFRINGQQISLNGMTLVGDAPAGGNGDGDTHTYEYRFTGDEANDKDYTVEYVSCTDKAGNASDSVITPQTFTVDKVQPTVSANDAAGYSSSALTYTATVVERNFDEAGVKVLVTKRLNGSLSYENREYPVIWSTSGDTHTAVLSFAEDGDYSFTITCTDKAGNQQAAVYTSKEFTVDNVDPVLTSNISEENNNIANKGNIDFEYVYTDINSSNESGMIGYKVRTLAGTAVNDWVPEIKNVNVDGVNGYTIKFHDNATATKLKDGIYTIELTVKDKAGREAKDEKQFSVNRHGSAYSYISSSYTGAVILQQYVKEITDDIEVVVMNCDDITQYQVEVWNSLNEQNILNPDEDYTWKKENSGYVYKEDNPNRESGFTMYSCKIKPEVFSNEGTYTVRVSTKDIADDAAYGDNAALLYNDDTNTDNNMDITTNMDTAQADKIEFTVDRTNPEIVIMDIDNNGKYNLDKKFSFDYADANELDDIKFVRKDGDKVLETITYKPSDLKDLKTGNISAVAKEYDGYQTITISATDKAGNTGSASVKVLVTSNLWIKYINNTPLVVATIVVVAAAAGGIFFVLFRRRRREEQN